jgi:hypothetical protein
MKLIDSRFILQHEDEAFALRDFEFADTVNG